MDELHWVEASDSPWPIRLLDLRSTALGLTSTTKDPKIAETFSAMCGDDGSRFREAQPEGPTHALRLEYATEGRLEDGILFSPREMEDKWALYHYDGRILCVRSWTGQVSAAATVVQEDDRLLVTALHGEFALPPELTESVLDYLIRSHALAEVYPAPLPEPLPPRVPLLYFSLFGRKATLASFQRPGHPPRRPLRATTRLHLACVRGQEEEAVAALAAGHRPEARAEDGRTALQWAVMGKQSGQVEFLLQRGVPVDGRADDGATALMTACEGRSEPLVEMLLARGAEARAQDGRGFTALHRAAEMGEVGIVRQLLAAGADPRAAAGEHTPLSLATARNESEVVRLLSA